MLEFNKIFDVLGMEKEKIPAEIERLVKERVDARKEKDYKKADKIRKEINNKGYILEDTDDGTIVKK